MTNPSVFKMFGKNISCHYCGRRLALKGPFAGTIDHVIPKSLGGTRGTHNIVPACKACNEARGSVDYRDFLASANPEKAATTLRHDWSDYVWRSRVDGLSGDDTFRGDWTIIDCGQRRPRRRRVHTTKLALLAEWREADARLRGTMMAAARANDI